MEDKKVSFPSIAQSWGIVGILIACTIIFSPLVLVLNEAMGWEATQFVYYIFAMGVTFILAHVWRNDTIRSKKYSIGDSSDKLIGLSIITMIGIYIGLSLPLVRTIPWPEFMKKGLLYAQFEPDFFTFLTIVIAAPVIEEFIFRGIILDGFLKRYSPTKSIVFSSFLFGLVHLNPWQFVAAFFIGLFAGWVYYKTKDLLLPILIHLVNNLLAFVLMFFIDFNSLATNEPTGIYGLLSRFSLVSIVALIVVFLGIYYLRKQFLNLKSEDPIGESEQLTDENLSLND